VVRRAHFFPEQSSVQSLPPAACAGLFFYLHADAPLCSHFPVAQLFFCMQSLPARVLFFSLHADAQCPVTSLAHRTFFLHAVAASGHFPLPRAQIFFFLLCCRIFFLHAASGLSFWLCMTTCGWKIFYLVNSRGAHAGIFLFYFFFLFLSGHISSAARADFLYLFSLSSSFSSRHAYFFFLASLNCSVRRHFFLSSFFWSLRSKTS
jgi:hypothetical protein